jgi:uncharacterized protein GlcG (DUF336 family)
MDPNLPFQSNPGSTQAISVSTASALTANAVNPASPQAVQVIVTSPSTNPLIFIRFDGSGAVATSADIPILPGSVQTFSVTEAYAAALAATGTGTLYVTTGRGV